MTIYRLGGTVGMDTAPTRDWRDQISTVDVYELDIPERRAEILSAEGLIISGQCDHLLLLKYKELLTRFVSDGGKILVNGQIVVQFIDGLARWSKLEFRNSADVRPHGTTSHAIWEGVDYKDLHYRTGVPGTHSYEELSRIGVAGFYGRGYHTNLPDTAVVITGIGSLSLPLDYAFTVGAGEVVVHGGLDLDGFADPKYSSAALGPNIVSWFGTASSKNSTSAISQGVNA